MKNNFNLAKLLFIILTTTIINCNASTTNNSINSVKTTSINSSIYGYGGEPNITTSLNNNLIYTNQVGAFDGNTVANGVTADKYGNTYVVGYTSVGLDEQTQHGEWDYFITKYAIGKKTPSWTTQVGASNGDTTANGVTVDKDGNIYVVGETTVSLDGQTQYGDSDYFIAKYAAGKRTPSWTTQVGANGGTTQATGVTVDKDGNIYVVGETTVSLDGQTQHGGKDYFIAKYAAGKSTSSWTMQVGASGGWTSANGITADKNGNIYVVGDTNVGINGQTQHGDKDYFITKYVAGEKTPSWTNQVGESDTYALTNYNDATATGVTVDKNGNVYVVGYSNCSVGGHWHGWQDYFIAKYAAGKRTPSWTTQVGANQRTEADGVTVDKNGNVYVVGTTNVGISGQTQHGLFDYFITKYAAGKKNPSWTTQVGVAKGKFDQTSALGVTVDKDNNVYAVGATTGGINRQTQHGNRDYFITKYGY